MLTRLYPCKIRQISNQLCLWLVRIVRECFHVLCWIFHLVNVLQSDADYIYILFSSSGRNSVGCNQVFIILLLNVISSIWQLFPWAFTVFPTVKKKGQGFKGWKTWSRSSRSSHLLIFMKGNCQTLWCTQYGYDYIRENFLFWLYSFVFFCFYR